MTEKQQSSILHEQVESLSNPEEDETSLADLLDILIKKKIIIFAITVIFTIFSILYAKSLTPIYQASIAFLEPQETYLSALPPDIATQLPGGSNNPTAFFYFLSEFMSFTAKEEVFRSGDFLKKFYGENSTVRMENAVLAAHHSISATKEETLWVNKQAPEYVNPIVLRMEGLKPEVMAEFLTALANSAKQNIAEEINNQAKDLVDSKIKQISSEIEVLYLKTEKKIAKNTAFYTEALTIAKNLGVKDHNFDKAHNTDLQLDIINKSTINSFLEQDRKTNVEINIQNKSIPIWYLFGEKALQLEINKYKNRKEGILVSGLVEKESLLKQYTSINLPSIQPKVYTLSLPSIPPTTPIKPNKKRIVTIGMSLGLIVGVIIALLRNAVDQRKMRMSSTSTAE